MSIVPEIERQLRDAAERRSQGLLTRMLARGRSVRGRFLVRPLMIGLAVLVSGVGVAFAAKALVGIGSPAPREYPNLGERILPAGTRLLSLRVPDPAGGPPWGMRLIFTTARPGFPATHPANRGGAQWGCVQVGRVVDGELGVLGQDGAFHDDGLFHELPVQPEACGSVNRAGQLVGLTGGSSVTASGYRGLEGCVTESERRQEQTDLPSIERESAVARVEGDPQGVRAALESLATYRRIAPKLGAEPICPAKDLRHFAFGMAGPRARSVTVTGEGLHRTIRLDPRDDGAYLVVRRSAPSPESLAVEAQTLRRTVHYENGRSCPEESSPSCVAPSGSIHQRRVLEAGASPGSSTAAEEAPASARSREAEADPATPNPVTVTPATGGPHTSFKLTFRTLLNGGGYSYLIKAGGPRRCQRAAERATGGDGVAIGVRPIVRGETITKLLVPPPAGLCSGRYTIYVAFSDPKADALQNFPFATVHLVVTR
ncbi:MAG TPA: hypothetical protein VNR42_01315 [Solirubrobacteraceae bacterium]|nr:hypothetical protein [Solirubrobacteraceae bacterium]